MKITIIGTGNVGLVTGACLSEMGNGVLCLDLDPAKVRTRDEAGIRIHEAGLASLVARNAAASRLAFTTDVYLAVERRCSSSRWVRRPKKTVPPIFGTRWSKPVRSGRG